MTPIGIAQSVHAHRWRYGKFCAALPHLIKNIIGYYALNCRNFSKSPIWRQNSKNPGKSKVDFRFSMFFQNDKRKHNFSLDCAFSNVKKLQFWQFRIFSMTNSAKCQSFIPQNFRVSALWSARHRLRRLACISHFNLTLQPFPWNFKESFRKISPNLRVDTHMRLICVAIAQKCVWQAKDALPLPRRAKSSYAQSRKPLAKARREGGTSFRKTRPLRKGTKRKPISAKAEK